MTSVAEHIIKIKSELPDGVNLVAVSKYHPIEQLKEAYTAGQRLFGESHAQELVVKAPQMPDDVQWHFIGHLQRNKVRAIMPIVSMIHSVDSIRLLDTIKPQYIILKPSLHGGVAGTREWIALANERGIGSWITSALESNIGLNAIAQLAADIYGPKITMPQGLGTGMLFTDNIPMPLEIRNDCLWITKRS